MKVEAGTVTIVRITDLMESHRLDPIRVTLDDIEPGKGRINIECYGKAWASYWGAMGEQTIAQFFASCDNDYLIRNLAPGMHSTRYSADALVALCKRTIRQRRKGIGEWQFDRLSNEAAEDLMERASRLECETESQCWTHQPLLEAIFGADGVMSAVQATEPNPEYAYLARICNAVREALRQLAAAPATESTTPA